MGTMICPNEFASYLRITSPRLILGSNTSTLVFTNAEKPLGRISRACGRAEWAGSSGRSGYRRPKGNEAVQTTLEQIDLVKRIAALYPADFEMAYTAADVGRSIVQENRFADRHRRRPPDRQLACDTASDVRARRPIHDADTLAEHRLGRLSDGCARAPRPDADSERK